MSCREYRRSLEKMSYIIRSIYLKNACIFFTERKGKFFLHVVKADWSCSRELSNKEVEKYIFAMSVDFEDLFSQ